MMVHASLDLQLFAKVRAVHDRTDNPGEKASAAARMRTLAIKAGMTVEQAVSKLDAPKPTTPAEAFAASFNDFFNSPEMRADRAERERMRAEKRAAILIEYGTEDAVFADTPLEAALRAACEPLLGPGQIWDGIYRLDGWGMLDGPNTMPESVRRAVSESWPLPTTMVEAWVEYEAAEKIADARAAFSYEYTPHAFVNGRRYLIEELLNTLPARSLNDLRARFSWMDYWADAEIDQHPDDHRVNLSTLRADIERMATRIRYQDATPVQFGQPERSASDVGPSLSPSTATAQNCAGAEPEASSVQNGQAGLGAEKVPPVYRTTAERRVAVLELLSSSEGTTLSDREIARRVGVSPQTVGNLRRKGT